MELFRCVAGLIECRLMPETAYELVVLVTVAVLWLLVLATLAEAVLLQVAAMVRWRARRRRVLRAMGDRAMALGEGGEEETPAGEAEV